MVLPNQQAEANRIAQEMEALQRREEDALRLQR